ncbi:hypothetical protein AB751O23_AQ_00070 [Chlamydiales bacterium SCGC AB-751-O23]|jgi:hypothetical protein|nr:hypothetical protein AB751O23_AQ_00070 [Chlamydiales bacterium SCGC AB-751-O23]
MKKRKASIKSSSNTQVTKKSFLLKSEEAEEKKLKLFNVPKSSFNAWTIEQVECFERLSKKKKLSKFEKTQLRTQVRSLYSFFKNFNLSVSFLKDATKRACENLAKNRQLSPEFCELIRNLELISQEALVEMSLKKIKQHASRCRKESSFLEKSLPYFTFLFLK